MNLKNLSDKELRQLLDTKKQQLQQLKKDEDTYWVTEARKLIKMLYDKFAAGGRWIKNTIRKGRTDSTLVSPIGRVRHLWGYLHHDNGVKADNDRRGPNTIVQGTSSDMGYQGAREVARMVWEMLISKGYGFSWIHENMVHDSVQSEVHLVDLPLAIYLVEHGLTTRVHKKMRDVFDFEFLVDLEVDFELGGVSEGDMVKWDYIWEELPGLVRAQLKKAKQEFGYIVTKKQWKAFLHNLEIIKDLRTAELAKDLKDERASTRMYLNDEIISKLIMSNVQVEDFNKEAA